ncbi:hypothetical protein Taro_021984 [Colocasia esculenta]|uniref:Uncharacterized protein n=1 Tax=Colocasia esculenta TaxID=4460 RepID=A0A843V9X8_COLES|nr:hypothetical protein [Colocasia esculenta]
MDLESPIPLTRCLHWKHGIDGHVLDGPVLFPRWSGDLGFFGVLSRPLPSVTISALAAEVPLLFCDGGARRSHSAPLESAATPAYSGSRPPLFEARSFVLLSLPVWISRAPPRRLVTVVVPPPVVSAPDYVFSLKVDDEVD